MDTLDPSSSSETNNAEGDMSYLFGRDPSILAYSQRPCVSKDTKKNLFSVYENEGYNYSEENGSVTSETQSIQTVKVYLRMKPFPKKLKLTEEQQNAYKVTNATSLFTRLPTLDNNTSCLKKSSSTGIVCRNFTFTKTFGPKTTQLELFEQAVKQQMVDFLAGQSSTIMTYGTTNSGKSYTLQGTTTSPGIIPRCLEFVFSNITPRSTPAYKPMNHCDVIALDSLERAQELEIKSKLLTFASVDKYQYINAYKEMQKFLQEESPIRPSQCIDAQYSVWVSFAEIYNEIVYDLLSNECQKKRSPLKLATDNNGRAFIKGLKTVCVNSGSEAYQVLMAGQYNLKVAATALNARSSRSHCIFTIKLLKYYAENNPNSVEVSTFAFCDLAGSERLKKTLNIGDRLKEAQNINTSLLVLGRCLKTIHEGQLSKQKLEHIGPFRESKLTRLFQKALSGKEHIALIVNINPIPTLYIETQNVLNFSAIAKKIVIEKEKIQKKSKSRFSQLVTQSIKTVTDWDAAELESEEWQSTVDDNVVSTYTEDENYEELISENQSLKKEIAALKSSAFTRDLQIRQEMADTYTAMMKELEIEWKNRIKDVEEQQEDALQWSVKQVEDFYKQKLDQLSSRKRRRSSLSGNNPDDMKNIDELEIENSRLTSKIVLLRNSVKDLKESNQSLTVEKNKINFELGLTKDDLQNVKNLLNTAQRDVFAGDGDAPLYIEELKSQLFAKQEQVKKLKVFLNEAKEEYIAITTEVREKEYIIKEQEEDLFEKQETIEDLEADIAHINVCLADKTKDLDVLEEKFESQTKKVFDYENVLHDREEQISKLEIEKLALLDEIELLKNASTKSNADPDVIPKNDAGEDLHVSSKVQEEITIPKQFSHSSVEIIVEDTIDDSKKEIDLENEKLRSQVAEKMLEIEEENSALKQKLVRSTTEIQSLKEEVESAKVKLKDISEQICNLKIQPVIKNAETKVAVETTEIGCQVHMDIDRLCEESSKGDIFNKSSQTLDSETKETISQTSFSEESDEYEVTLNELAKLTIKYDDIKTQYDEKCEILRRMDEEVLLLKHNVETLSSENKVDAEEYKQSIQLLQQELFTMREDKKHVEETLKNSDDAKVSLEAKINDYERRLKETEEHLSLAKNDYNKCTEELNSLRTDLSTHVSKCTTEHEEVISNLQKELSSAQEKNNLKSQCLDVHTAKILELQHSLEGVTELQQNIKELNENLERCQAEKDHLQLLLNENTDKLLELEDRLESAGEKEREKDAEIISLQKEMKQMIQKTEFDDRDDKLMELEVKSTIKDLAATKEMLSRKEEYIEQLEIRVKHNEQNAKILDLLQQSAQERQVENERLRAVNEELKNSLVEKEREMETFMKNRDEMVSKYETLVKTQQEELEKQKRVVTHHSKERDYCGNTSEDDVVLKERRIRRPPKKFTPTSPKQDEISVIELSGSESKRSGKRMNLLPPDQVSERRKNTRKKKLYNTGDASFQDIEPLETTTIITPSSTRSLRSRRK